MNQNVTRQIYTVSCLTREIKNLLEEKYPFIWVSGEISNLATPVSGHSYFSLKDDASLIQCVMFRNQKQVLKFRLENGIKVFGLARLSVYEPRGSYQLIFEHLEPEGTGSLQMAFEQLKEQLAQEGLFDSKYKKQLPFLPHKVGIITSKTGSVIRDIIHVATRRYPNCNLVLFPVKVQGAMAAEQICHAIKQFNQNQCPGAVPDVLILARGGGSLEDMAAFNCEAVARAVFQSDIPVVTGVGHETDFTIADFVADLRAPTPSAAAEMVIPEKKNLQYTIQTDVSRLQSYINRQISIQHDRTAQLVSRLKDPMTLIYDHHIRLEDIFLRMQQAVKRHLVSKKQTLDTLQSQLKGFHPERHIKILKHKIKGLTRQLNYCYSSDLETKKAMAFHLTGKLEAMSPETVLKRGYSITRLHPTSEVITQSNQVNKNQTIEILLSKGQLIAEVKKTDGKKENV